MFESRSEDGLVLLVKLVKSTDTAHSARTACTSCRDCCDCWNCWDCIDWRSEKSITYSMTHWLTHLGESAKKTEIKTNKC